MNAVTTWARDRGAEEVVLTVWSGNEAAAAFYQRLGYRRISQALGKAI
jgi:ribosomal protein S18 acetylase RimI-like enzyme